MSFCTFLYKKLLPFLLLLIAISLAYILSSPLPMGTLFATVFKIVGLFNPEVVSEPTDLTLNPRWENEIFFQLPSGAQMPGIGLGLCCRPAAYDDESVRRMVLHFLLQGGRTLDTAHLYLNHRGVGQGIRDAVKAGVSREEIFVTTKIWPSHFGGKAQGWTEMVLEELGLEYVDLVLLHAPDNLFVPTAEWQWKLSGCENAADCRQQTWKILSNDVKKGLIRDLGVSNFKVEHIEELKMVENGVAVAANQIQFNPWATQSQKALVEYCVKNNIVVTGYSSLGGLLSKDKALARDAITKIAEKYGKTSSQVLLRWSLQNNVSVIPGTKSPKHMRSNLEVYTFSLSNEDVKAINEIATDTSIYLDL